MVTNVTKIAAISSTYMGSCLALKKNLATLEHLQQFSFSYCHFYLFLVK
jgi:hypothetical protein